MEINAQEPSEKNFIQTLLDPRKLSIVGVLVFVFVVFILFAANIYLPTKTAQKSSQNSTTSIKPASSYQNPFDKQAQYTNPFSSYKNPFDNLK